MEDLVSIFRSEHPNTYQRVLKLLVERYIDHDHMWCPMHKIITDLHLGRKEESTLRVRLNYAQEVFKQASDGVVIALRIRPALLSFDSVQDIECIRDGYELVASERVTPDDPELHTDSS